MLLAQLIKCNVDADIAVQDKFYAALFEPFNAADDDGFIQLKIRDTVNQKSARAVMAICLLYTSPSPRDRG